MIYRKLSCFTLLLTLLSCVSPFRDKGYCGAEDFVLDSYQLQEGSLAVLKMQGKLFEEISSTALDEYPDTIKEGDLLGISIFLPRLGSFAPTIENLSKAGGFRVKDHKIFLPDVGSIVVEGLTLEEARDKIEASTLEEMGKVEAVISFLEKVGRKVELAGMVHISSVQADGRCRLYEALAQAQIPPQANLLHSYLKREGVFIPIDFYKLLKEGDMSQNIVLREGDKIYIAEPYSASVMVVGEVGQERKIAVPGGTIPIKEALAEAGGISPTGNPTYIQVIRGGIASPKTYLLNWEQILRLPNSSALLMAGDMVYIGSKPITEWHRFVSQLIPSIAGVEILNKGNNRVEVIIQ